jgi:site-specific recombinase XerD
LRLAGLILNILLRFNRIVMLKAELLKYAKQKLVIQNYSQRTIASYFSAINSFASWLIEEKVAQVFDEIVEND